jgi:hypothetical protein
MMTVKPDSVRGWISVAKDVLLLLVGIFIIIHETLGYDPPSRALLLVAGTCIGLPIATRVKSSINGNGGKPTKKEEE